VGELIAAERALGIGSERIVIAGFSQGAAVALHAALRHPEPLAGVLALSCYLPLQATLAAELSDANRQTPILMCHGVQDPVLPVALGLMARDWLRAAGYRVEWKEYPMQHQVCLPEIQDIAAWLRVRF
jgi:phospholipase/carboxylesterase